MRNDQFARLLKFAQRTGDRVIVTDPEGNEPVVILPLDQYEILMDCMLGPDDSANEQRPDPALHRPHVHEDWDAQGEEAFSVPESAFVPDDFASEPPLEVLQTSAPAESTPNVNAPEPKSSDAAVSGFAGKGDMGGEEQFYLEPV